MFVLYLPKEFDGSKFVELARVELLGQCSPSVQILVARALSSEMSSTGLFSVEDLVVLCSSILFDCERRLNAQVDAANKVVADYRITYNRSNVSVCEPIPTLVACVFS